MMIWLTLLPFTLWDNCGWAMLPITFIISFLLLGEWPLVVAAAWTPCIVALAPPAADLDVLMQVSRRLV